MSNLCSKALHRCLEMDTASVTASSCPLPYAKNGICFSLVVGVCSPLGADLIEGAVEKTDSRDKSNLANPLCSRGSKFAFSVDSFCFHVT